MRHKEGFAGRLLLASVFVAVLSLTAPVKGFAENNADPARIAGAKELLAASGTAKQFEFMVPLITQQIENAFVNAKPDHAAEIKEVFRALPEKFLSRKQELLDQVAAVYAERLTTDELKEIVNFYQSPVGAKYVQLQPELMKNSMQLGQAWSRKVGQDIEQEARKVLKERGVTM